jgi:crossover junction endodeoxyribonuclease RuvC
MILGVDAGLAAMGWAVVEPDNDQPRCVALGVIRTEPSDRKRKVGAADDLVRRTNEIWRELNHVFRAWSIRLVSAESFSPPRNASSAAKTSIALGQVIAHAAQRGLPFVQSSPQEVKKATTGSKSASKDDVEAAVRALYRPKQHLDFIAAWDRVPPSLTNHAWDALAVVRSVWETDIAKAARVSRTIW